jgi:hypothetical protein
MGIRRNSDGQAYADAQDDIPAELHYYSDHGEGSYFPTQFADAVCRCKNREFLLLLDDSAGVAVRICGACGHEHTMADGKDYLDDAELEEVLCLCDVPLFEITVGVHLYRGSDDVRWLYVGCRCVGCGLTGCYGDWKNEFEDYRKLLKNV